MKKILLSVLFSLTVAVCRADGPYHFIQEIPVGGDGGWDYCSVDSAGQRLYVSHGTEVVVIDLAKDQVVGVITNTPGVHGLAPAPELGRGFVSCGRENKAAIVDLKTLQTLSKVDTGQNPDGMLYEPGRKEAYLFNGRGQSATVIDVKAGKVVATIPLDGKPEFAQADPTAGRVYDNLEDKSEVAVIDTKIAPGRHQLAHRAGRGGFRHGDRFEKSPAVPRLWRQQTMVMMDSTSGKVIASVPIGQGVDANAFDPGTGFAFASCGDGTTTIAHEDTPDKLTVVQTLETQRGSRTMTIDPEDPQNLPGGRQIRGAGGGQRRGKMVPAVSKFSFTGWRNNRINRVSFRLTVALDGRVTLPQSRPMRVLVVEDEKKTASFVRKALQSEGFAVDVCHNGNDALAAARATPFDGIVLDIMLPGRDGLSVLRQLRERKNTTPVLLLSARGEVNERVEGLNAGADDYLPKPFELAELVARVRAVTRRSGENKSAVLRVADLTLDTVTHRAQRGGADIELTAREYRLLEFLMRSPGRLCGRMMILEKVWDYDFDPGTNLVDVYVRRLREKIDAGFEPKLLHTVRGAGYVLKEQP